MTDNTVSRSTSSLAAPEFAAALLDQHVLRTIAVGRHVLLLAAVAADDDTVLAGERIGSVHRPGLLRVIALRPARRAPTSSGHPRRITWSAPATGSR
ncbi:MAG: hypothetical protein ACRDOK_05135 [Streptosporangiaceae bacterium]